MHRLARPCALLVTVLLALLAGAVSLAGPATALGATVHSTATPQHEEAAHAAAPATQQLTAPAPFGLPAEAAQPPSVRPVGGTAQPSRHPTPAQRTGTRQDRAPPAVSDY